MLLEKHQLEDVYVTRIGLEMTAASTTENVMTSALDVMDLLQIDAKSVEKMHTERLYQKPVTGFPMGTASVMSHGAETTAMIISGHVGVTASRKLVKTEDASVQLSMSVQNVLKMLIATPRETVNATKTGEKETDGDVKFTQASVMHDAKTDVMVPQTTTAKDVLITHN